MAHGAAHGGGGHDMPSAWTAATVSLESDVLFRGARIHSPGGWAGLVLLSGLLASAASELAAWSLPLEFEVLPGTGTPGRTLLAALGCAGLLQSPLPHPLVGSPSLCCSSPVSGAEALRTFNANGGGFLS